MCRTLAAFVITLTLATAPAVRAGIADSPLPVLVAGQTTLHLYSVPGVISGPTLDTFFSCTSTDTATMQVRIEFFGAAGGTTPSNDAAATSVVVAPGATVILGTGPALGIPSVSTVGSPAGARGSARILATSKKLVCTAFLADPNYDPPTSMAQLTIIAKTKQKAAN